MVSINHQSDTSRLPPPPEEPTEIIEALRDKGFAHVKAGRLNLAQFHDRGRLFDAFEQRQELDPNPGRRWRSYGRVAINRNTRRMVPQKPIAYYQSRSDNYEDGGKDRIFKPIQPSLMTGPTLRHILENNVAIASALFEDIAANTAPVAGVHFISYRPDNEEVSFSSPMWLHRDSERFVSVTIFDVTDNLSGGENLLSPGGRSLNGRIDMRSSMDTLYLLQKPLHAVAPMSSKDGLPAHRNVILCLFD